MAAEDEQAPPQTTTPQATDPAQGDGLIANLRRGFGALPRARRQLILAATGAAFLGLIGLIVMSAGGDGYITIKSELTPEDQAAAVASLEEQKIPHRLGARGSIEVPRERLHDARLAVELVTGGGGRTVGYELFDDPPMGLSSQAERLNRHRALEGELARTISQIDDVQAARVHVVLPRRRPFKSLDTPPSASVVLKLRGGATMSHVQIRAIQQLVASAVERLGPNEVTLVDHCGIMLSESQGDDYLSGAGFEQKRDLERGLAERVVHLLEPVIGQGNVQAQVALDMDFSKVVETTERYDPESQVVRSEREQLEKRIDAREPVGGPPGTASNLPDRAAGPRGGDDTVSSTDKSDTIKNYDIDKSTVRREQPTARVERMTVSVMLNERPKPDGQGTIAYTPDELARYEQIVSNAVGFDPARGDKITVTGERFVALDDFATDAPPPAGLPDEMLRWILIGAGGFVLLLALLILWLVRRRRNKRRLAEEEAARQAAEAEEEAKEQESFEMVIGDTEIPFEEEPDWEHEVLRTQIKRLRERAMRLGQEDIRRLVVVFERWFDQVHIQEHEADEGDEDNPDDKAAA